LDFEYALEDKEHYQQGTYSLEYSIRMSNKELAHEHIASEVLRTSPYLKFKST
jgi:hypothetical protein